MRVWDGSGTDTFTLPTGTIGPYGYKVYFDDSFTLPRQRRRSIRLYDLDAGTTLIDSVATLSPPSLDKSYGRQTDGSSTFVNFSETPVFFTLTGPASASGESFTLVLTGKYPTNAGDSSLQATTGAYYETAILSASAGRSPRHRRAP